MWNAEIKKFYLLPECHGRSDNLFPMKIFGPTDLYMNDPKVCNFVETSDLAQLMIRSLKPKTNFVLAKREGIWCVVLDINMEGNKTGHRVCFNWKPEERLDFIQCPDLSLLEI